MVSSNYSYLIIIIAHSYWILTGTTTLSKSGFGNNNNSMLPRTGSLPSKCSLVSYQEKEIYS